jgi:dienelactone hydrolase
MKAACARDRGAAIRLGVTDFCRGGRIVRLYVARDPNLKG